MSSAIKKRFYSLLIPTLVIVVLVHEIWTTPVYTDRELAAMRESAVALASQGDVERALEKLRALSEVAPRDRAIWGDYLTELARARRDDEVLTLYRNHLKRPLPDYALAELFDAAIRKNEIDLARAIADREIAQSKDRDQVAAARQRVLADIAASHLSPVVAQPVDESPPKSDAIATEQDRSHMPAMITSASHAAVLQLSPRSASHRARTPVERAPAIARVQSTPAVAQKGPEKKSEEALADNARDAVRRAEWASAAERVARAEAALPVVQSYEASLPNGSMEQRNAKLDRVRALTLADHLDEAAALFETLGPAEELPLYGVMNGADLYARRHEPERAQVLLDVAAKRQPDSRELLVARYYNQLDLEQYDHAEQTLTKLRETTTDERSRRDVEIMSAMFAAYQNDLEQAQQQLERMLRDEPHNTDIQLRLAQIYRWRGWPRRALGEYRSAADIADDPTSARVGEIAALDDLHAFTQSHVRLQQLTASAPTHPEVIQSNQDRRLRERWDYSAQILTGHSSGGPVTTGGDLAFEQKLYSPPLGDQYRAFVHQRYDWADFPEGTGSANRLGVGGDFRSPALDGSAELTDRVPGGQLGLTVSGEWKFGDRFSAFGEAQTDSTQVPLRAVHAGIDGHSETLGVLYRADESHSARASFSRAHFSDGNQRNALIAQYQQTIFQDARSKITGVVQGYYSDNSAGNNVPYFNPASESLIGIAGIYEGVLWRGGERRWSHRLQLGISDYEQKYFGSGGIWDAEYEQRWQLSDSFSFNYGLLYRSRIYDGGREGYIAVLGGINWRF